MTPLLYAPQDKKIARITGLTLLLVTLTHMAGFQIAETFQVSESFVEVAEEIKNGEPLYRLAIFSYAVSSLLSVGLAVGFYYLLKPISHVGAVLVLAYRLAEAMLASGSWAIRFALIDNQIKTNLLGDDGAMAFHQALKAISNAAFDLSALSLGLASIIGFALFLYAKTIPRILSAAAIMGGVVVLVSSTVSLIRTDISPPAHLAFAITLLSQLAIGAWLLCVGVKTSSSKAPPSP